MTPVLDLLDPALYVDGDPHGVWRWLRHHQPVHWHEPSRGFPGFWGLTKHADVMSVLHDPEVFSSEGGILLRPVAWGPDPGGGRTLALTDPPRHRKLRGLVQGWFTERAVRTIHEQMGEIAAEIVDRAIALEACDFVQDVAARFPLYVICRLMGVPDQERDRVLSLTSRAFGSDDPRRQRMAHIELLEYFTRLCQQRSRDPRDDIVSALARAEIDGEPLNDRDLMFNCDNVLVAGTENVRIASSGGLLALIGRAGQWDSLRSQPERIEQAVDEVLRWTTTPTHIMRTARTPAVVGGQRVQAGDRVVLWLPSANRDEDVFERPDEFDVTRASNRHVALGHGQHFCLGSSLARAELAILYTELLSRPVDIELTGRPTFLRSIVVSGPATLPVRFRRRP
jgi:cytochrome P450